jgi:hypothetical protein
LLLIGGTAVLPVSRTATQIGASGFGDKLHEVGRPGEPPLQGWEILIWAARFVVAVFSAQNATGAFLHSEPRPVVDIRPVFVSLARRNCFDIARHPFPP